MDRTFNTHVVDASPAQMLAYASRSRLLCVGRPPINKAACDQVETPVRHHKKKIKAGTSDDAVAALHLAEQVSYFDITP